MISIRMLYHYIYIIFSPKESKINEYFKGSNIYYHNSTGNDEISIRKIISEVHMYLYINL